MIGTAASTSMLAAAMLFSVTASTPVPLYSNASTNPAVPALSTGTLTGSGVLAPNGLTWSEAARDSNNGPAVAIAGYSGHQVAGTVSAYRFADDFVVPAGQRWRLSEVELFAYYTGGSFSFWPFDGVYLQIWNGPPDRSTSRMLLEATPTNSYVGSSQTTMLRVFNTTAAPQPVVPTLTRRIWSIRASLPNISLGSGTYWLDWQFKSSSDTSAFRAMVPPVTIAGTRSRSAWNAMQAQPGLALTWLPLIDPGKPSTVPDATQDLPFILKGVSIPPGCAADANNDGRVNNADLAILLANWGRNVIAGTLGDANSDAVVNFADLSVLLAGFNSNC